MKISYFKVILNLLSSILGLILPGLLYITSNQTLQVSFSAYHFTSASNILLISLLFIAFNFLINVEFRLIGFLLMLIAIINLEVSEIIHNIISTAFFLAVTFKIFRDKRLNWLSYPIFLATPLVLFKQLYLFELITVTCLSVFTVIYNIKILKALK